MTRYRLAAATWVVALAAASALFFAATTARPGVPYLVDLTIYRESVRASASGGSLYDYAYHAPDLRPGGFGFTYPPFAAVAFWPLGPLPDAVGDRLWTLASLVAAVTLAVTVALRARRRPGTPPALVASGLAALAVLVSYPVASDSTGRMHRASGKTTLTGIRMALVSANWRRSMRISLACTLKTSARAMPYSSACTTERRKRRSDGTPARSPRAV